MNSSVHGGCGKGSLAKSVVFEKLKENKAVDKAWENFARCASDEVWEELLCSRPVSVMTTPSGEGLLMFNSKGFDDDLQHADAEDVRSLSKDRAVHFVRRFMRKSMRK